MEIKTDQPVKDDTPKQKAVKRSKQYTNCIINAALTIDTIHGDRLDVPTVARELLEGASEVAAGNIREIEMMLMTQAQTLNVLFHRVLTQIANTEMINQVQAFSDIALRAQNQSRKTLAVLAELKNPRRATFIKQQNNAINQQVNNAPKPEILNSETPANKLVSEVTHEKMDNRGTAKAISNNETATALAMVYRAEDACTGKAISRMNSYKHGTRNADIRNVERIIAQSKRELYRVTKRIV